MKDSSKYTFKEFKSKLKGVDSEVIKKAFSLVNGMISLYGYDKDLALNESIRIAEEWFSNDGNFPEGD